MLKLMMPFCCLLATVGTVAAQQPAQVGTIVTGVRTGWNSDSFAVMTREPIANPAHCHSPDGYIAQIADPGYRTYYAAALTAYVTKNAVTVTIDPTACLSDRPKLIGIDLH
jgi:hypothetical protein